MIGSDEPVPASTEATAGRPVVSFRAFPLLPGGHLQTIGGHFLRALLRWRHPTEDVELAVEDEVTLLLRASWQPSSSGDRPALLLLHGLEGSDASPHVIASGDLAYRTGWHVIRMNMRGCGDSLALCPRLYNAGLTGDLVAVLRWLGARVSWFAIGAFSLGANLSLLTLAREPGALPASLGALVAVCPPLHMSTCADALEEKGNWIYQHHFLSSLRASYRKRQRLVPSRYQLHRERRLSTLREFDERVTAHYGGYDGAVDYYRRVSPGPHLEAIDRPTLILASDDDPFIPAESVTCWPRSKDVALQMTRGGGHVGFVSANRSRGRFWAADRMLEFCQERRYQ